MSGQGLLGILDGFDPMPVVSKPADKNNDNSGTTVKPVDERHVTPDVRIMPKV